ncbi:MAG: tetratricopeptide repeat protein [Deltaproteobacteria bacterium]|nr:tetratricopeptide repeat protein [Deltaproteobacteria bacterium]MBI3390107.1 tetratricopeptide repeat protein [Deltaproteobacteria bacterium]
MGAARDMIRRQHGPPTRPLLLLCALLFVACATEPAPPPAPPSVFSRAENAFQRADYERAIEAYRAFLQHPTDDDYLPRAWYKIALSQYRLKEYRAALATLNELAARFPKDNWPQVSTLRGDVHLALGNTVSALQAWAESWRLASNADRPAIRARCDRVIDTMSEEERVHAKEIIRDAPIRAWLDRTPAALAATAPPPTPSSDATAAADSGLGSQHIAALLPLSGPSRAFGERALQGIQLGLGIARDQLVVQDTGADSDTARTAFTEVAGRSDVIAVIGPLRSEAAAVIAPLAEDAHLPLLLLAQREGLAGRYVFPTMMTRSQQADVLAREARRQKWLHVGVLAPDDGYGHAFTDKFRNAFERAGGRVTWADTYDPKRREISAQLVRARERHEQNALDAVFVPDTAEAAVIVGATLREALPGVGLMGANDWNDPAALSHVGAALDGAIFVTGFFADSARPATHNFVDAFHQAYGSAPDVLAALAYDAGAVVREMLREVVQQAAATRDAVADALHHSRRVIGATGDIELTDDGIKRDLFVVRIAGGKLQEVAP